MKLDFSGLKVMVVGEAGIDRYIEGTSNRQSPEAPVPVIANLKPVRDFPGMAANLANNIDSLGAKSRLFTVLGDDSDALCLFNTLTSDSISYLVDPTRPTIVKTRILSNGKQVARLDKEQTHPLSESLEKQFYDMLCSNLQNYDAVFLQDYGKGLWTRDTLKFIKYAQEKGKKVFVDPFSKQIPNAYSGAYLVKPNKSEATTMTLSQLEVKDPLFLMKRFSSMLQCDIVTITLGGEGLILKKDDTILSVPATKVGAVDVTGAGDTTLAALGLSLLAGNNIYDSAGIANLAAGISVQKKGVSTVTVEEIKRCLSFVHFPKPEMHSQPSSKTKPSSVISVDFRKQ